MEAYMRDEVTTQRDSAVRGTRWDWAEGSECRNAEFETDPAQRAEHAALKVSPDGQCWACHRGFGLDLAQHAATRARLKEGV